MALESVTMNASKSATSSAEVIQYLREFFEGPVTLYEDFKSRTTVWDILTALRGPDNQDLALKEATTEVIRHAISPAIGNLCMVSADHERLKQYRSSLESDHFVDHAKIAFALLGLEW